MGMYGILGSALSGLRVTQSALDVVARNVANADTPGYTRKTLEQSLLVAGDTVTGIRIGDIQRQVNTLVQRQMWLEGSGTGYIRTMSSYSQHLDMMFGAPGSAIGIDTLYNSFHSSLESLTASPESFTVRDQFLRDAQALAQSLNQKTTEIQAMRLDAERGLGNAVQRVNELLSQIATVNQQIASTQQVKLPPADLLDLRDRYVNELSHLIDIRVVERERGEVSIFTASGALLLDLKPSKLVFDQRGMMTPEAVWSKDDAERGVGTIRLETSNGLVIDLINDKAIRSGEIAALVEMRDRYLPQAQAQLDALADAMARALSAVDASVDAATVGDRQGFEVDLTGMLAGDRISMTYTVDGVQQTVTVIRVDDPAALPLSDDVTPDPSDRVIGIDFSGGMVAAAAQLAAQLGPGVGVGVEATAGGLRFLDDGDPQAASSGAAYGVDGTTLDLAALDGESLTVTVNGTDHLIGFTAPMTGADLEAALSAIPGLTASIAGGDLVIDGDTPGTSFSLAFSDPSVGALTGLAEGSHNTSSIQSLSARMTATTTDGGHLGIPLFIDGNGGIPYSGSLDGTPQQMGFAGRIKVDPAILADNSKLVLHSAGTAIGDPARPAEMLRRLTQESVTFSGRLGMGSTPYSGTVGGFVQRVMAHQGAQAADIARSREAQEMVLTQLEERFTAESGVNIDQEMARLIELQMAYNANTRVVTAFREMMNMLMQM